MIGTKCYTEALDLERAEARPSGSGVFQVQRSLSGSRGGVLGSNDAGLSSAKTG